MRNYNWSEEETAGPFIYSNKFGVLELEPVTKFMPVSEINRDSVPEIEDVLVSIDDAEKVTLITENRRAYMSFCYPSLPEDRATFALKYSCRNRAAVCRINIKRFETAGNISAREQIESMAPKKIGPIPLPY